MLTGWANFASPAGLVHLPFFPMKAPTLIAQYFFFYAKEKHPVTLSPCQIPDSLLISQIFLRRPSFSDAGVFFFWMISFSSPLLIGSVFSLNEQHVFSSLI